MPISSGFDENIYLPVYGNAKACPCDAVWQQQERCYWRRRPQQCISQCCESAAPEQCSQRFDGTAIQQATPNGRQNRIGEPIQCEECTRGQRAQPVLSLHVRLKTIESYTVRFIRIKL